MAYIVFLGHVKRPVVPAFPCRVTGSLLLERSTFLGKFHEYIQLVIPCQGTLAAVEPAFVNIITDIFRIAFRTDNVFCFYFRETQNFSGNDFHAGPEQLFVVIVRHLFRQILHVVVTDLFHIETLSFQVIAMDGRDGKIPGVQLPDKLSFLFCRFR